jgi:hypothetical protein
MRESVMWLCNSALVLTVSDRSVVEFRGTNTR